MKKHFKSLVFVLPVLMFSAPVFADSGVWELWKNEDEEDLIAKSSGNVRKSVRKSPSQRRDGGLWENEDEEPETVRQASGVARQADKMDSRVNDDVRGMESTRNVGNMNPYVPQYDNVGYMGGAPAYPYTLKQYTEITPAYPVAPAGKQKRVKTPAYDVNTYNSRYGVVDYDTLQSERTVLPSEVVNSVNKWQDGRANVFWENYRGNNVRVEVLRNNRDLKEVRLKFVQSQSMNSDPDASISDILNVVANQVMKRICGKKSKQSIILYERPSVELTRETSADGYKVMTRGTSLKEYGFRCIY